jgi:hypothetical protein
MTTEDNFGITNDLGEPLLSTQEQASGDTLLSSQDRSDLAEQAAIKRDVPAASEDAAADSSPVPTPFSIQNEIVEMLQLALPLAVSFFCRMGMASTDR